MMQITGITKRALHYYDKTELLKPSKIAPNGYRFYDQEALANLQTILLFKEMNFSLVEISRIMTFSKEEQKEILIEHRFTLVQKRQKLETIINQLDEYVKGTDLYHLNLFQDSPIHTIQEQYELEAKLIYGDTEKFREYEQNAKKLSETGTERANEQFSENMERVFRELAKHKEKSPDSAEVQKLISIWSSNLEQFMVCDAQILICIAEVYTTDSRYINYFKQFGGEDYLEFLNKSIVYYVRNKEND